MRVFAVIPARYDSSRFPGKALADKTGKYLIQHVYEQVTQARLISEVVIATDDQRIFDACGEFGARCFMTRGDHVSGTDRVAEVAGQLAGDIIVNVQGDEPEVDPAHIDAAVELLRRDDAAGMATLAGPLTDTSDIDNPNIVKVVIDCRGHALYFSRWPIPYRRDPDSGQAGPYRRHIGLYAYRPDVLVRLSRFEPTPLERSESLEQLRALENGIVIAVADMKGVAAVGIDTPRQYEAFVRRLLQKGAGF